MILRHLAVCFGVEIDGINIDILKVLVWGAASPVSIGIYCDCFGSVSIGSIYGIFAGVFSSRQQRRCRRSFDGNEEMEEGVRCLQPRSSPEADPWERHVRLGLPKALARPYGRAALGGKRW